MNHRMNICLNGRIRHMKDQHQGRSSQHCFENVMAKVKENMNLSYERYPNECNSSFVMKLPCELLSCEKTSQNYSQMLESLNHPPLSEKQSCNFQDEGVIRVGSGYQANIPEITHDSDEFAHDDQKLWDPRRLPEEMVNEYLKLLSIRNATEEEKALWILHTCNYDVEEALKRQRFAPQMMIGFDSDWSEEERSCFEKAVRRYGKAFHSIQKMLRTKSVVEIVEYYYYWKHQRMQNAQMNGNSQ